MHTQFDVSSPRVEIGRVRLHERAASLAVRMKDELVRRKEVTAMMTLDAFRSRTVVSCGHEASGGAVGASMVDLKLVVLR